MNGYGYLRAQRALAILLMLVSAALLRAQPTNGPWQSPLRMAWSSDGRTFSAPTMFQDSSGVPSAVLWKGDTLVCAFQWFRAPRTAPTWDRVAVKFSYDAGLTWTEPTPIVIQGMPLQYQRPFDPTLAVVGDTLRLYFSSSDGMPSGGLSDIVNTYSAISTDGVTYTFEPGARYDVVDRPIIDPAVVYFRGQWHYAAPRGAPQEGAHHAVSADGLLFTPQPPYPSDGQHNWTGNYCLVDDSTLRFYGSGPRLWYAPSSDAASWQPYVDIGLQGGDPTVVRVRDDRWLIIYVGPRQTTSVDTTWIDNITIGPNPTSSSVSIRGLQDDDVVTAFSMLGTPVDASLHDAAAGTYVIVVQRGDARFATRVVKLRNM
ncbi:MAG: T9SS type A sorting domain-containing protein [Candidatus Kapabacteria bacterium]|nr:T9SS type A sorting domain-containing protein [Candidatus Kapabacteria bacterium]